MTENLQFSGSLERNGKIVRGELWLIDGKTVFVLNTDDSEIEIKGKNLASVKEMLESALQFIKKCELW